MAAPALTSPISPAFDPAPGVRVAGRLAGFAAVALPPDDPPPVA
jgi:hypothetical protein